VEQQYGLPVISVATLTDLLQYLSVQSDPGLSASLAPVQAYRARYGV
jgi:orotate phosphoribosyltransferase